ncbi:MAG: hypothetical protein WCQ21_30825 [Verrucomicrobiota bacterium]|jgi:hypothetical protein
MKATYCHRKFMTRFKCSPESRRAEVVVNEGFRPGNPAAEAQGE